MKTQRSLMFVIGAAFFVAGLAPGTLWSQESSECGPMCHMPMGYHGGQGEMAWRGPGPRLGTIQDMKRAFGLAPRQVAAWRQFQEALRLARLSAFDAEELNQGAITYVRLPQAFETETFEPVGSIRDARSSRRILEAFLDLYSQMNPQQRLMADRYGAAYWAQLQLQSR